MEKYEYLKDRFSRTVFKKEEDKTKLKAIEKAYADMSKRASGHTPEIKETCVKWLYEEIFTTDLSIPDFDEWHEKTCKDLVGKMNQKKKKFGTIGRAQKVINMTFKYLSCIDSNYNSFLEKCHMTLDGYTLAWYKSFVAPWVKEQERPDVEKIDQWSKINKYEDYATIQKNIRDYLATSQKYTVVIDKTKTEPIDLPVTPFKAEFIVWEGEIAREKYKLIISELKKYREKVRGVEAGRTKDEWLINDLFDVFLKDFLK